MKFTMTSVLAAALVTVVSGAAIEKRDALPAKTTLSAPPQGLPGLLYNTLMYAGNSAYIGNIKYESYAEALTLSSASGDGGSFTSFHSSPTGQQRMYVLATESQPIGFTIPHSNALPAGAVTTGFSQDSQGLFLLDRGNGPESLWKACPADPAGSWQIYWDGANALPDCTAIDITVNDATCSA